MLALDEDADLRQDSPRKGDAVHPAEVVAWHVDRGTHLGRRTAVVQESDEAWEIVSYHASNVDK